MKTWVGIGLAVLCALGAPVHAADRPGEFDYWILALSWSPQFCRSEPAAEQCTYAHGFIVHGLWPQHEQGYPDYCGERSRVPKELIERMLPLMPSTELIQRQWRKHGSCSGLPMQEYFLNVERAWRLVSIPPMLRAPTERIETSVDAIEHAFIEVNPRLQPDGIAVQCRGSWLSEIRICLDRDFQLRRCGADVEDRCRSSVQIRPVPGQLVERP